MRRYLILFLFILFVSSVNALVFTVTEGELVKLKLDAYDPDGKELSYTYSSPLNEKGEWQTQIGDAGQYNIIVTVSDGKKVTKEGFTLIVKEKEELIEEIIEEIREEAPPQPSPPPPIGEGEELIGELEEVEEIIEEIEELEEEEELEEIVEEPEWEEEIFQPNNPPKLEKIKDVEVTEGELVKISPVAYDEDDDKINYDFAYPLNEQGKWQTEKGDYGEYVITVTATDGMLIDSKTFKVIVKQRKKREINFEKINDVVLDENSEINIRLTASIEDGTIEYFAENMPSEATLSGNVFHFKPDYDYVKRNFFYNLLNKIYTFIPKKSKTVIFIAKSDDVEKRQNVKITVTDVNRKPTLEIDDIEISEGEKIIFNPIMNDEDGDWLKIKYDGDIKNNYQTNFDDAGNYKVKVIVSDPFTSVEKDVDVVIKNKNREPIINELPFSKINENEKLKIKLISSDPDNDKLSYYIAEGPGSIKDDVYKFTPGFDFVKKDSVDLITKIKYFNKKFKQNNKEITVRLGVSDGNLTDEKSFKVVVFDINQKPELINFEPEDSIIVARGGRIVFSVDANDLDNDELTYKWNFGFMNSLEAESIIARTFTKKGIKKIKVTVSDGVDEVEKVWKVRVI